MLHSTNLWNTIDKLAEMRGMSLPKLALDSGLDQSTFSHARRKRNWPSMQTIARVLNAQKISIEEWARLVDINEPEESPAPPSRQ